MTFISVSKENLLSDLASEKANLVYFGFSLISNVFFI